MRQLYHIAIDPGCRAVRVTLAEKSLDCELRTEKVWERREVFLRLNPAGQVPVFVDEDGTSIPGSSVIAEYLEECRSEEHTSELQSLMRISYAVFCLKKKRVLSNKYTLYTIYREHNTYKYKI